MSESPQLSGRLDRAATHVNVVLFSQPGCEFCLEVRERYLRPLALAGRAGVNVAEASLAGSSPILGWGARALPEAEFARDAGARFAPTVMFLGGSGQALAEPIVGLSRDYFGAYLDQRLALALSASRRGAG